ncbi:MaoC family dehydratase N-terminal domain-containing protein [Aldersonia sp. NBC_00410]|uniref:FAS1-like dehydratase domain-containing protein n=1 Tax=Aldersonia sp. NBC_00410 TaxID=2975954 RepID=UPI0022525452|nr:MaoC family dehydratase N-terminal domain-containing protein [Aldersonia sp. NBC_00410]MCX5045430.1 MaoC family dehydratase N-terminal domain-containing protein [Aldersonia sp. NBC_00410]
MTHSTTETGLGRFVGDWHPEPVDEHDELAASQATRLAATLELRDTFGAGDALPIPWHWVYFPDWPKGSELGVDGHPRDGHFLPPIPNRRRMFAGSRIEVHKPLRVGRPATKRARLARVQEKTGRSGEMLFVTIRSEYRQDDALCVVEEQNLVYRSDTGSATAFARNPEQLPESGAPWHADLQPDEALLFRFSALTSNAHRIHYDHPYVTGVEGYPGLVVHGPLLAVYMAELARSNGKVLSNFEFRLQSPAILGDPLRVEGTPASNAGTVELAVVSGGGRVHASATGQFA